MASRDTMMSHELHRWGYMDTSKLVKRVGTMSKIDKMEVALEVAMRRKNVTVVRAIMSRADTLGYGFLARKAHLWLRPTKKEDVDDANKNRTRRKNRNYSPQRFIRV